MNDIRRTILWVIFGFSMVMLWDQWQVFNGRNATFFPSTPKPPVSATATPPTGPASVPGAISAPAGSSAVPGPVAGTATATPGVPPVVAPAAPRQTVVVTTDVL